VNGVHGVIAQEHVTVVKEQDFENVLMDIWFLQDAQEQVELENPAVINHA